MNIGEIFSQFASWLVNLLLWLPRKLFSQLGEGFVELISSIPVPDFVSQADYAFASLPSGVVYAISFFRVPEGLAMIISAYILRFIIRRIPFFG